MTSFELTLLLHALLATTSVFLFLFRSIRLLFFPRKNQFRRLKRLTIGIDSLLTITGVTQIIYLNYQPLTQYWFLAKISLLVIYILAGIQSLKENKPPLQRMKYLTIALIAVFLIVFMAVNKPF